MDDDEDLEMLRLAALKSLKKENGPIATIGGTQQPAVAQPVNKIPVVNNVRYVAAPGASDSIQPNLNHHPVPIATYIDSGFEKMDISDAYAPHRSKGPLPQAIPHQQQQQQPLPPLVIPPTVSYAEFIPYATPSDPITNVQLSPRSAAFVYENKQIIKRRQGIAPPSPPSPPLNPFRQSSPGRWSRSPSPDPRYHRTSRSPHT